jgi:hypothetical protein
LQVKKEADYEGKPANEKASDHHANHLYEEQINREIIFLFLNELLSRAGCLLSWVKQSDEYASK